jgi:pimeloyl-ACP methyl ester carboxylesterase
MTTIQTKDGTQIYFKDWGKGQPIVFHHGWPLTADDWDAQMLFFLHQGYRVIAHDRCGHGRSSHRWTGNCAKATRSRLSWSDRLAAAPANDMDTCAADETNLFR